MELEMIVEWSLGSLERFWWDGERLRPHPPPAQAAPVNYGLVPAYFNPADQDYLDAIWASLEPIPVGQRRVGQVLGLLYLADGDHKAILGPTGGLEQLDWAGLWAWFAGREVRLLDQAQAMAFIRRLPSPPPRPGH